MNIFKILSTHDGKIHEPSITSLLAYLLAASEDHGLSSLLLKSFVEECNKATPTFFRGIDWGQYDVVAEAKLALDEQPNGQRKKRKTIDFDVLILFYSEANAKEPSHVLGIENKIKDSSRRKGQLMQEWAALEKKYPKSKRFLCFLTPSFKIDKDFEKVPGERKIHLVWKGGAENQSNHLSVLEMLVNILQKEQTGEIDPIPGDSKFLIKSLLAFIRADFKAQAKDSLEEVGERRKYGGKALWMHLRDFLEKEKEHAFDKDISKRELKKEFGDYVAKLMRDGTKVSQRTLDCQFVKCTANDENRSYYGVKEGNHEQYDLMFYPDPSHKDIVRLYRVDASDRSGNPVKIVFKVKEVKE